VDLLGKRLVFLRFDYDSCDIRAYKGKVLLLEQGFSFRDQKNQFFRSRNKTTFNFFTYAICQDFSATYFWSI